MLSVPTQGRVYLCIAPTDMRKSFDGLCGLVQTVFAANVLDGHVFVFVNRRGDRVKLLHWDRDGLVIWAKRLEQGSFAMPKAGGADAMEIDATQLAMLLGGVPFERLQRRKRYARAG